MIKKSISLLILTMTALLTNAQNVCIEGKVYDRSTKQPLAYASLAIEKTTLGTVTNAEGLFSFSIPQKHLRSNLLVRYIGYKTDTTPISNIRKHHSIALVPLSTTLRQLVVMPKDTLIMLIKKAERAIPNNYPKDPISYTGFFRSTIQTPEGKYLDVGEAIIKGYKNSYKHERHDSQIEIVESRKWELKQKDSLLRISFYGGIHESITSDYVLSRSKMLQGNRKYYDYKLEDIIETPFGEAYKISFDTNEDTLKGKYKGYMLINKKSLAFQYFDIKQTPKALKEWDRSELSSGQHEKSETVACYEPCNGIWNLKYAQSKMTLSSSTIFCSSINSTVTFIVSSIDSLKATPIPFDKQIGYREIYMQRMKPYDISSWKDYSIIRQDSTLTRQIISNPLNQIARKTTSSRNKEIIDCLLKHISRIYYSVDLLSSSVSLSPSQLNLTFSPTEGQKYSWIKASAPSYILLGNLRVGYSFTRSLSLFYAENFKVATNSTGKSIEVGLGYRNKFSAIRKSLYLNTYLSYYNESIGFRVGQFSGTDRFKIEGKTFNTNKSDLYLGHKDEGVKLEVGGSIAITPLMQLKLFGSYNVPFYKNQSLIVRQPRHWYQDAKSVTLSTSDSRVTFGQESNVTEASKVKISNLYLGIGLLVGMNLY